MSEPLPLGLAAGYVLFHLESHAEGVEPGSFYTKLIEAACHADPENLYRLTDAFPSIGTAVNFYKNVPGGVDVLRTLAKAEQEDQRD